MVLLTSRRLAAGLFLGATSALTGTLIANQPPPASTARVVYVATVDSIIHPVSAEYMIQTMDLADRDGAALVVFTLRTPGGLVDSTRDIVARMLAAKTPVAIFVGPAGARAASAGFILTIAADVAAMAPGTHIGAAHPVAAGGEKVDETTAKKAAADVAAYARTLAGGRRRNVALAEQAVNESRAFTEREALAASPPLIDLLASDVPDLLRQLDGRPVRRFDSTTVTLATTGATIVSIEMTQRQRALSAIAHPTIAFLLLSLGILGLTVEMWTPGAVVPGVVGGISLLLAFFALQLLPVNYAGLLLIVFGLLLLGLEIKVTSYGLLTAGGIVSLVFGAMILMDAPEPELRLSLRFVVPVVLGFAGIALFLVRLAVKVQGQRPVTGAAGIIGAAGEVLTAIEPGRPGQIRLRGEIWRAVSTEPIAEGTRVRVTDLDGLTLSVRKV
ncbi:MAG TPA: NfeD family protein [Vicinamibacterales bacterium]|nr:NfeD family protein [Vicinamibacterales bacterium]